MPQADLLLASQNPGKLREMKQLFDGSPFHVLSPRDLGLLTAPEEPGTTFLENATVKALRYAGRSDRLTVADDSGLSVDALDGGPGLYSSRFGGEGASDLDRNRLLLQRLDGLPREKRGARFTSAIVVARKGTGLFQAQGGVDGFIAEEMRGSHGFGYDPLFFYPPFGKPFGEVAHGDRDRRGDRCKPSAGLRY